MISLCPICAGAMAEAFTARVLGRHAALYESCNGCGFLRVRDPHWLAEAFSSAIAATDTGLVLRNLQIARRLAAVLYFVLGERGRGRYLDAAGGYGLLTRLMRDSGFDFYWADKYCDNLMARGFAFSDALAPCAAVTAFEVMEHLEDPAGFIREALARAKSDTFIFSTELYAGPPPAPDRWWYYSLETGQHIAFYQRKTLEVLAEKSGLHFYSAGGIHLFSKRPLSRGLLRLCASRASLFIAPLAQKRLGGKVWSDNELMIAQLKERQRGSG